MQPMKPLRTCRVCGLKAHTETDLDLFKTHGTSRYGREKLCWSCYTKYSNQRACRTAEFIEIFRARSFNGVIHCHFCGEEVKKLSGWDGESLCIHSLDGDHQNWNLTNKTPFHRACHIRYHNTGERSPNWKGDKAREKTKRQRVKPNGTKRTL